MAQKLVSAIAILLLFASGSTYSNFIDQTGAFNYTEENPDGSNGAGDLTFLSITYDLEVDNLFGSFNLVERDDKLANTGWMVLSPGDNPKGSEGDHGILYMDFLSGDSWLYQYNGQNNPSSYRDSSLLAFFESSLEVTEGDQSRSVEFNYDLGGVDAPSDTWTGLSFGEQVGIWFHGLVGEFSANEDGIQRYRSTARGQVWHDSSNTTTVQVPEIDAAGLPLAGMLLLSVLAIYREKRAKTLK